MIEYKVRVYSDRTNWLNRKNQLHREDGPAIEEPDGTKCWYLNGKLHREDGPAIEDPNGTKCWFLNGKFHREDGPAIEYSEWWLNGIKYSEKEFWEKMKPSQSCNGKVVEIEGKKYKLTEI